MDARSDVGQRLDKAAGSRRTPTVQAPAQARRERIGVRCLVTYRLRVDGDLGLRDSGAQGKVFLVRYCADCRASARMPGRLCRVANLGGTYAVARANVWLADPSWAAHPLLFVGDNVAVPASEGGGRVGCIRALCTQLPAGRIARSICRWIRRRRCAESRPGRRLMTARLAPLANRGRLRRQALTAELSYVRR